MVKVARHREAGVRARQRWSLTGAVAIVGLVAAAQVQALGLGRLQVRSALDEPLVAEIPLQQLSKQDRQSLRAALASREQFAKAGIPRLQHLTQIRFSVASSEAGDLLRLSTDAPVREPFLHFLVQLDWSGGRLVKEYTALLDPPQYVKGKAPQVSMPATAAVESAPVEGVPLEPAYTPGLLGPPEIGQGYSIVYGVGPEPGQAVAEGPAPQLAGPAPAQIGPTRRGDTLWSYSRDLKQALGASEFQIMLSLLRENPDAFVDGNINRLRVGKILKVPSTEEVRSITQKEASAAYVEQYDAWQHFKLKLAEQGRLMAQPASEAAADSEPAPPATETAPAATAAEAEPATAALPREAGKPPVEPEQPAAADAKAPDKVVPEAQLKIVQALRDEPQGAETAVGAGAGEAPGAAGDGAEQAGLLNKITTLEEAVVSGEMENKELRERLKILEEQVANAQRLIELQDQDLALAQQQAAQQPPAVQAPPQETPADGTAAEAVAGSDATAMVTPAATGEPEPASEPSVIQPAAVEPIAEPEPVSAKPRVTARTEVPGKGLLGSLLSLMPHNWPLLVGAIGTIIMLGVVGLWMYRRRRSIAEFEESILSGSALDSRTHTTPSEQVPSGTDTSFLSDFGVPGMGSMHADEVDPLAEAEVYLAYGRSEQAEEVLREAANKNPQRPEIKLKLLEIYEQRKDLKSFETLAEELYPAQGGESDPVWAKVVQIGRRMNPNNPLFRGVPAGVAAAAGPRGHEDKELEPFPEPEREDEGLNLDLDDFLADSGAGQARMLDLEDTAGPEQDLAGKLPGRPGMEGTLRMNKTEIPGMADLDLDLDKPGPARTAAETLELDQEDVPTGELDLESTRDDLSGSGAAGAVSWEEPSVEPGTADTDVEFELGMPAEDLETGLAEGKLEEVAAAPESGNGGDGEGFSQWDETATKLDLAKAYIDMGDESGARSILDEVLAEGNEKQKQQASALAAQLGA